MTTTKRRTVGSIASGTAIVALIAGAIGIGIGAPMPAAGQTGHEGMKMDQAKTKAAASTQKLAITFTSKPSPPVMGDNAFEVTVKEPKGAPIADADVSLAFHMAAMPSMNMAEMKNEVKLKSAGDGVYRGNGQVMMGGKWDVTVHVKQGEKEIGKKLFTVNAK